MACGKNILRTLLLFFASCRQSRAGLSLAQHALLLRPVLEWGDFYVTLVTDGGEDRSDDGAEVAPQSVMMESYSCPLTQVTASQFRDRNRIRDLDSYCEVDLPPRMAVGDRRPEMIIFYGLDDTVGLASALEALEGSAADCFFDVRAGLYHYENVLVFADLSESAEDDLFSDDLIRRHPRVSSLRRVKKEPGRVTVTRFDLARGAVGDPVFVDLDEAAAATEAILAWPSLRGFDLTVSTLEYDAYFILDNNGDSFADDFGADKSAFRGIDADLLADLSSALGFRYRFALASADIDYDLTDNGTAWVGLLGDVVNGDADMCFGITVSPDTLASPIWDRDSLVFATRHPTPHRTIYTVLKPLNLSVWACVAASFVLASIALAALSKTEHDVATAGSPSSPAPLSSPAAAGWVLFGTMVGEGIVRGLDDRTRSFPAARVVLGFWLWTVFVLTAGYAGNLRAFLLLPSSDPPVDTLQQVVDSPLPVVYYPFGFEGEATSDPANTDAQDAFWRKVRILDTEAEDTDQFAERARKVYSGELISSGWVNEFDTAGVVYGFQRSSSSFDRDDGYIVHRTSESLFSFMISWRYPVLNAWSRAMDSALHHFVDSGLFPQMQFRNRLVYKSKVDDDDVLRTFHFSGDTNTGGGGASAVERRVRRFPGDLLLTECISRLPAQLLPK